MIWGFLVCSIRSFRLRPYGHRGRHEGRVGIVPLPRGVAAGTHDNADWYRLLDLCALTTPIRLMW